MMVDRRDVTAGEHPRLAVARSFPPVGIGVVEHLNFVSAFEAQLALLLRLEVKQSLNGQTLNGEKRNKTRVRWCF